MVIKSLGEKLEEGIMSEPQPISLNRTNSYNSYYKTISKRLKNFSVTYQVCHLLSTLLFLQTLFLYSSSIAQTELAVRKSNPLLLLAGSNFNEQERILGFLRTAAYGINAIGAQRVSPRFEKKYRHQTQIEKSCFVSIPERFQLFKKFSPINPCLNEQSILVANTQSQMLYLCKNQEIQKDYDFALGWSGTGKTQEGDQKTPLGIYPLLPPRDSGNGFYKFIPIGYPTEEQKIKNYTGGSVGLHGPSRWARCLGFLNVAFNWTDGCLAVASDNDIDLIAKFVTDNKITQIKILPIPKN